MGFGVRKKEVSPNSVAISLVGWRKSLEPLPDTVSTGGGVCVGWVSLCWALSWGSVVNVGKEDHSSMALVQVTPSFKKWVYCSPHWSRTKFLFCFVCFSASLSSFQGLLLDLCSEIIPGGAWGSHMEPGIEQSWLLFKKCLNLRTLTLATWLSLRAFLGVVWGGGHLVVFKIKILSAVVRSGSWWCSENHMQCWAIKPGSATCKANALTSVLSPSLNCFYNLCSVYRMWQKSCCVVFTASRS